ncbi:hypothetical protein, conserved [Leishmania donovani]|uniref:Uncharacterized protein n=1 Tax=Leishmania donovani TaxID=5661 RepID=E9BCD6_LEIDO|nr:hypothetical protein, conserved [Leishmania donovani]CBZ32912.1 hypothetical protein, conserved [Leishmania donovani]
MPTSASLFGVCHSCCTAPRLPARPLTAPLNTPCALNCFPLFSPLSLSAFFFLLCDPVTGACAHTYTRAPQPPQHPSLLSLPSAVVRAARCRHRRLR